MDDYYIIVALSPFLAGLVNLFLCEASLLYFINRYNISNNDIQYFLSDLNFPFTLVFSDNPIISSRESDKRLADYFVVEDLKKARFIRLSWGCIALLIPASSIIGSLSSISIIKSVFGIIIFIISLLMFILAWRFGHTLKSKARPDQSPTD